MDTALGLLLVAPIVVTILKVAGVVLVIVIFHDAGKTIYYTHWGTSCGLVTRWLFPDLCLGPCTTPNACNSVTVRPYMIWWWQDASCACMTATLTNGAPSGAPGGTGGPPMPGAFDQLLDWAGLNPITKAEDAAAAENERVRLVNEAIAAAGGDQPHAEDEEESREGE